MHTDENKKFDKRNIARNIKEGIVSQKDYEIYLSKLPDASDKLLNPEEFLTESEDSGLKKGETAKAKKRPIKKKTKGKGK